MSNTNVHNQADETSPTAAGVDGRGHEPEILDHEYDGIREYDNPTPGWWHILFLGSCVFSVLYFFVTEFSPLYAGVTGGHAKAEARAMERMFATMGELEPDTKTFVRLMHDPEMLSVANSMFQTNCVSCHASDGGGLVGPNLTDESWKNVRNLDDIYNVISDGAAAGAMPAWGNRLHKNERVLLTAYVASLRGKTVKTPKAPEGQAIPAWPTPADVGLDAEGETADGEQSASAASPDAHNDEPGGA